MPIPLMIHVPDVMPLNFAPAPPPPQTRDRPAQPVQFILGVDLGQSRDFTAVVVNEISLVKREHLTPDAWQDVVKTEHFTQHRLRHVERVPLGTSYPDIVRLVRDRGLGLPAMPREPALVVDATGVGRPVLDMMRSAGLHPFGVTITGGAGESVVRAGSDYRVAKRLLSMGVAVAPDTGRLAVTAPGEHRETLRSELSAFKVKVNPNQNESFESFREKDHDDLVLAAALAVWLGDKQGPRSKINPNFTIFGQ